MDLQTSPRSDYIDSLRGVAIICVVFCHVSLSTEGVFWPIANISAFGARGVTLFFILSALTLTKIYSGQLNVKTFLFRRFLRIGPMFYLAMVLYLFFAGTNPSEFAPDGIGMKQVMLTATFLNSLSADSFNSIVPGGWSISCEALFYVLLPLLLRYIRNLHSAILAVIFAYFVALSWSQLYKWSAGGSQDFLQRTFVIFHILYNIPAFVAGITLHYIASATHRVQLNVRFFDIVLVVALMLMLVTALIGTPNSRNPLLATPLFVAIVAAVGHRKYRFLSNYILSAIGKVSYSMYFWHFAFISTIDIATNWFHPSGTAWFFVKLTLVLGLTYPASTVTYRFVEVPFIRVGKRCQKSKDKSNGCTISEYRRGLEGIDHTNESGKM